MNSMLPSLPTERLLLAPLAEHHLNRFMAVAGERSVADTTISVPHPLTEAAARAWILQAMTESAAGRGVHFAVLLGLRDGAFIGYAGIRGIDGEHHAGDLSFWLGAAYGGNGYATEAARAVVDFGFANLQLNRICAYHMVRNPASGRVLAKLGFQREGCLRQRARKWGVYEDVLVWARLKDDLAG